MAISRNLEKTEIYINKFVTGLLTNRSPLYAPLSAMGLQTITRYDTLWDGQNADISQQMTLKRRPGFSRYCSASTSSPQQFFRFRDTSGTIRPMVETTTAVSTFTTTALTTVFTKTTTQQGSLCKVGDALYYCNGTDALKWVNGNVTNWGIAAPATAPTISLMTGYLSPLSGYTYVYVYKNSLTGHVSTASPVSASTLPRMNKDFILSGEGSTDTQVDQIEIYRTADGGSIYYLLAAIANAPTWTYTDSTADTGLNTFIEAPLSDQNDPPPQGIDLACFYLGYMWVAVKNLLYFGGGSSVTNGVPEESFPPANVFKLPGDITAFAPTSQGLVVFTADDAFIVMGSDILSFRPILWQSNFGVKTQNAVAQDGDVIFVFTSTGQLFTISSGLTEVGHSIAPNIGVFDSSKVYLTVHRAGADEGLFISNGVDTIYRYSNTMQCWSTAYKPVGGVGCISSIEVSTSNYRLLLGRTTTGYILNRDVNTYTDDGTAYPASATIGSLTLAPPRQTVTVSHVLITAPPAGTYPTVSVLMNEVSGTFVPLPHPVQDPPELVPSKSIWMMRHDLLGNQARMPLIARHMQIQITWPSEAAPNELYDVCVV